MNLSNNAVGTVQTRTPTAGSRIFHSCMGGTSVQNTLTLKGLGTTATYHLIIYSDWFWGQTGNSYPIIQTLGTGFTGTAFLNRPDRRSNDNIPPLDVDTNPLSTGDQGNWIRLAGLSPDSNGHLQVKLGGTGVNQGLSGFQLIGFPNVALGDYATWAAVYAPADLRDPAADPDGDGMTNNEERAFGLHPTSGASANPISVLRNPAMVSFSYPRRDPALTGLNYSIWTSTSLSGWTRDPTAVQTFDLSGAGGTQTVAVTLTSGLRGNPSLFVRVRASEQAD